MDRTATEKRRPYRSDLRETQAETTRVRILDALVDVLAEGVETLSVPAVAERAGVSIGTVYRHFGDKAGLVKALIPHAAGRTGTQVDDRPSTLEELGALVRKVFHHFENTDALIQAAFASRLGRELRMDWTEDRLQMTRETFRVLAPDLTADQVEHLSRTALILTASDTYREWRDRLGLSPDEAADEVMWTIRSLIRGVKP